MEIKFIKTERECGYNKTIRDAGETKGIIYDYVIMIDGVERGVWNRNYGSIGYNLFDSGGKPIKNPDSYMNRAIRSNSQDSFLQTIERYIDLIPTPEQIIQRKAEAAAAKAKLDAKVKEEQRIQKIKEAGPELLTALDELLHCLDQAITRGWVLAGHEAYFPRADARAAIKKAKGE